MNTSKLKNIILIVLVLLNAFLLSMLLSDRAETRRGRESAAQTLRDIMAERGVTLSGDVELELRAPAGCTVVRDMDDEKKLMRSLLGDCSQEDQGGHIYFYPGKRGQASLRGTGEMDLLFEGLGADTMGNAEKTLKKLFKKAGWEINTDGFESSAEFYCTWDGFTVYNAKLSVDLSGQSIQLISGTRVFDRAAEVSDAQRMDCTSALMRFLGVMEEEGYVCSRIESVQAGYIMSVTMPGECSLRPVWRVDTDTGSVYINAVSGIIETLLT